MIFDSNFFSSKPVQISCTKTAVLVLTEDQTCYTWGTGHLGFSPSREALCAPRPMPLDRAFFDADAPRKITTGESSFGVVTDGGDVFVWGGDSASLGIFNGESTNIPFPFRFGCCSSSVEIV